MSAELIFIIALGLGGGYLSGLIASGAGVVFVPLLVIFGYSNVAQISAPAVAVACWAALFAVIPYYIRNWREQEWIAGLALFFGGLATGHLGVAFAQEADPYYVRLMVSFLAFLCLDLMTRQERRTASLSDPVLVEYQWPGPKPFLLMYLLLGGITGFAGGVVGSAGGLFLLPLLMILTRMPLRSSIFACHIMMAGSSISALYGQSVYGGINLTLGVPLAAGAIVGGFFGLVAAKFVSDQAINSTSKFFLSEVALFMLIWSFFA